MKRKQHDFRTEKYVRYGIRKYSFGAASVAIATGIMLFTGGVVSANEGSVLNTSVTSEIAQSTTENSGLETGNIEVESTTTISEEKVNELQKVEKSILSAKVTELEEKLKSSIHADSLVLNTAQSVLASAKTLLVNDSAKQEDINVEVEKIEALIQTVIESNEIGKAKLETEKNQESQDKYSPENESKTILDQVISEAEVTNVLANEAVRKNNFDGDIKKAIEEVISKNNFVISQAKHVLEIENVTSKQINNELDSLNVSMLAIYDELRKAGIGRDGKYGAVLSAQDFYNDETTNTTHASKISATEHTGSDTYTIPVQEINLIKGTDSRGLEVVVYSNQRDGHDKDAGNGMHTVNGGAAGHNNKGRVDYPLTPDAAKKLAEEAPLWKGKLRADGSTISSNNTSVYSANGGYEYLATEIYGYGYEQGVDRVYIKNLKERFGVTEQAKAAGWDITTVTPTNLVPGVVYDATTDTIQGKVVADIENGVYDLRFDITATNKDGRSVTFQIMNLRSGWVGWQDNTPPKIKSDSERYERTVGDDANVNIQFYDASGSSATPADSRGTYNYTTVEGKVVRVPQKFSKAVTGVSGYNTVGEQLDDSKTLIPGTSYSVANSTSDEQAADQTNMGRGIISGKLTEAGIYTVSVFAKDYDKLAKNSVWNQSGQEAHATLTVVVKPKVEVQNIETYSKSVPVKISKGATSAKMVMPDGTITNLKAVNGKWVVASGTTNTAVTENQELGDVDSDKVFNVPVTSEATTTVGVDNITVEASTEKVVGTFLREKVELLGTDGNMHTATLNQTTGHWELPAEYAEERTVNSVGATIWTKRQVYTEAQKDGGMKFYIYEYTRQLENDKVISVETPKRPVTTYASQNKNFPGDGMSVVISYDKNSNTWSSSDGSPVTASKLGDDSWKVMTASGFGGIIKGTIASNSDVATIVNTKPIASSKDYTSTKGTAVDLRNEPKAAVAISDTEDAKYNKTTYITRITVTSPSGVQKVFDTKQDANNYNIASGYSLNEVGVYTVKIDVIDSNGNYTTEATIGGTESGVDHGVDSSTATTTYHITVTDTIEGHNVSSTDIQGATQKETPTFTSVGDGSPVKPSASSPAKLVDPKTGEFVDTLTIDGQGTYSIDNETGKVTFVPLKTFTGTATPVTVSLTAKLGKDANDTDITATATATYTPTVIPVKPTSIDAESEGPKGQPQNGTPTFTGGKVTVNGVEKTVEIDDKVKPTFDDGSTKKVVPGEGTYTIDENGVVTFTPEKDFVGKASGVTVKRVDKNGAEITAKYTPTVRPITSFVDTKGNTLIPTEDGEQPKKDIPGYRFVETKKLPNGDTEHVYEKVKTPDPEPTPDPELTPTPDPEPEKPEVPETPVKPAPVVEETVKTAPQLPNTGTEDNASLAALGLLGILSGFGLVARKKKED